MANTFIYKGKAYDVTWESKDTRHGGPFDRGSADSYYGRPSKPHFYTGGTGTSTLVPVYGMSKEAIDAYHAGYEYNETVLLDKKDW